MPRIQKIEKVNNPKGTLINLFKNLDKWRYLLVLSIILSLLAAIFSTIAPNRLAHVTDVISLGIKPRVENIEVISKEIINHSNIPVLENNNYDSNMNYLDIYKNMSDDEKKSLFNDFEYDDVLITKTDQIKFLDILCNMDMNSSSEESLKLLDYHYHYIDLYH